MKPVALFVGLGVLICVALSGHSFAAPTYNFQTVSNAGDTAFNRLLGTNNAGTIAGYFGDGIVTPSNGYTFVLPNNFTAENFPGAAQTEVVGINNSGETVGFYIDSGGVTHGFKEIGGTFTTVDDPDTTTATLLLGVNDSGEAAGCWTDASGNFHPFTWVSGAFTLIAVPGLVSAQATDVNNAGWVVGFNMTGSTTSEGFLDIGGVFTTLQFPGSSFTQAFGLNNNGLATGSYTDAAGNVHGFIYNISTGTYLQVDDPNAAEPGGTVVRGINDEGQIVGYYVDKNGNTDGFIGTPVINPPTIAKAFAASTIPLNSTIGLTFTITNPNATASLSGVGFTDTLPSGLVVSTPSGLTGSCSGGTITATAGSSSISLSGASLGAAGSCAFTVNVIGTAPGIQNNTTSVVTSTQGGNGGTASASITVVVPPTIGKAFAAPTIPIGGSTALSFTVTNPNATVALTGVGFIDSLPSGLMVSSPNGLTGSCGSGTITATSGSASISLAGAALGASSGCSFTVNVTAASGGVQNNVTSMVSSIQGGEGTAASASITVVAPPSITKLFAAPTVPLNQNVGLTFTITNANNTVSLTGVSFTDNLPAGLKAISAGAGCGGTVSFLPGSIALIGGTIPPDSACIINAMVQGTSAGVWNNTTSAVTSTNGGTGNAGSDSITVIAPPVISKAFAASSILVGNTTTLSFTISNPNATVALSDVGVTDTLPVGLVVSTPNGLTGSCGGGTITATAGTRNISLSGATLAGETSCTFSVTVLATTVGTKVNTTSAVTSLQGGNGNAASATAAVLAPALINYFSNANTGGAPDATLRITEPGASVGNLCADIFVFDPSQELTECCSCTLTPNGLLTLSVNTDVTGDPLTGTTLTNGMIMIIPAQTQAGLCPLPTAITSQPGLRAWATHIQTSNSGFAPTETESSVTGESAANLTTLQKQCVAIQGVGSGHGICANSKALAAICNN